MKKNNVLVFALVAFLAACAATPYAPQNERHVRAEKFRIWWESN